MKLSIQPKTVFIPGIGSISANLLEVRVASYQLGSGATSFWQLFRRDVIPAVPAVGEPNDENYVPATPEAFSDTSLNLCGNISLTDEQFASWGEDDDYFAACIAQNLGLTPV